MTRSHPDSMAILQILLRVLCVFAFNKKALALNNQTQRRKEREDAKFYFSYLQEFCRTPPVPPKKKINHFLIKIYEQMFHEIGMI